jgi:hypothetical protein
MSKKSAEKLAHVVCNSDTSDRTSTKAREELAIRAEAGDIDAIYQLDRISTSSGARTRDKQAVVETLRNAI